MRAYTTLHVALLALLVAGAAPVARASAVVTGGCAYNADTTEANGWFTMTGGSSVEMDTCYVVIFDETSVTPARTCTSECGAAGLTCTNRQPQGVRRTQRSTPRCSLGWSHSTSPMNACHHPSTPRYCRTFPFCAFPWRALRLGTSTCLRW